MLHESDYGDFEAWQNRLDNCDFILPDELELFFEKLSGRMRDALSPHQKDLWFEQPTLPPQSDTYGWFKRFKARKDWLLKAIGILLPRAHKHQIDDRPFRWFKRLITGELPRDSDSARKVVDATGRLYIAIFGREGHDIYIWDVDEESGRAEVGNTPLAKAQPTRKQNYTAEERESHERMGKRFLRANPKATRDKLAKHLKVSGGYASGLGCWKARNPAKSPKGSKEFSPPRGTTIGLDIALKEEADTRDTELRRVMDEQEADARNDQIPIGKAHG